MRNVCTSILAVVSRRDLSYESEINNFYVSANTLADVCPEFGRTMLEMSYLGLGNHPE